MAVPKSIARLYEAGDKWLAECSPHPTVVRMTWEKEALAPIATGTHWIAVETQLLAAMHALNGQQHGPVLADTETDVAWWLVPADGAGAFAELRNVHVRPPGWTLRCPPTGWQLEGRFWLNRPDGSGLLTDPTALADALVAGEHRLPGEASA
ncbi:hypothetical protein ACGFY7_23690 [Streptomyces prunicolor]|uniref:hypothetical protein n=1 Tax=Streptomyces prunicolor TaxID=67348 RepID=UPI003713F646